MNPPNFALMMLPALLMGTLSFLLMVYIALQMRRIAIALETANRIPPLLPETQEIKVRDGPL